MLTILTILVDNVLSNIQGSAVGAKGIDNREVGLSLVSSNSTTRYIEEVVVTKKGTCSGTCAQIITYHYIAVLQRNEVVHR